MEKFVDDDAHKDDVDFEFIKDKQLFNALSENQMKSELIQLSIVIQVHYVFIYKDFKQYPYLGRYTSNSYDQSDNIFPKCKIQISDGFIFESKIYRINHKVLDVMFKKTLQYVQENSSFKLARLMDKLTTIRKSKIKSA